MLIKENPSTDHNVLLVILCCYIQITNTMYTKNYRANSAKHIKHLCQISSKSDDFSVSYWKTDRLEYRNQKLFRFEKNSLTGASANIWNRCFYAASIYQNRWFKCYTI